MPMMGLPVISGPPPFARAVIAFVVASVVCWFLLSNFSSSSPHRAWSGNAITTSRGILNNINNRTLGFEKVYVMGLPERTDRRDGLTLQAALSDMNIEFIDGVLGNTISDKAIPKESKHKKITDGAMGCWRAHMNVLHEIVRNNISSALIFEDDVDWDIRIRQQLHDIALSSQALLQPAAGVGTSYADPSYQPRQKVDEKGPKGITSFDFNSLPAVKPATWSPYGDDWDFLWLGHCGMQMPPEDGYLPRGRVVHENDVTVPEKKHLMSYVKPFTLTEKYPHHTRVVHHAFEGICAVGFAVTQRGAREALREIALKDPTTPVDILYRFFCNGVHGRRSHNCLAVSPPVFNPHRPMGPKSDTSNIDGTWTGWRDKPETRMTRWSVRLNAERIINGEEPVEQFPDEEK